MRTDLTTSCIGYSNFFRYIEKIDRLLIQGLIPGIDFVSEIRMTPKNNFLCIIKKINTDSTQLNFN